MKIHEYNEMMKWLTRPAPDPIFKQYLQGGRVGLKPGGLVEPGVTHYARQTSAEKRATHYKKLLENLPEGYYNEYVENFYTVDKDTGKLRHVSGGPEGKGIPYMEKKYGDIIKKTYKTRQGETINLNRKVRNINAAIKQSISDKIESGLKPSRQVRKEDLKIIGNWQPTAPKGYVTHHFMPLAGVEGESLNLASTKNTAFISKELNSKMAPYNTKLKANQKEQIKLLKEKTKGWEEKIEDLNKRSQGLYRDASRKIPGSSGYLGYSQYIKQPDGSYVPKVTGIDPNKSLAGLDGEEIFYKNITKENQLKVNKMSNISTDKIKNVKLIQNQLNESVVNFAKKIEGTPVAKQLDLKLAKTNPAKFMSRAIALGLGGELVAELAFAMPGYAAGKTGSELLGESIFGIFGAGTTFNEELAKYADPKAKEIIDLKEDMLKLQRQASTIGASEAGLEGETELQERMMPKLIKGMESYSDRKHILEDQVYGASYLKALKAKRMAEEERAKSLPRKAVSKVVEAIKTPFIEGIKDVGVSPGLFKSGGKVDYDNYLPGIDDDK